jgi:hypothetical protein
MGGLGNQMFQYATARRLAYQYHTELRFDITVFDNMHRNDTPRHYDLDCYKIRGSVADKADLARMLPVDFQASLPYKVKRRLKLDKRLRPLGEASKALNDIVLRARNNTYLVGWWQNEGYFLDIRDILLEDFHPKRTSTYADKLLKQIGDCESVSIHVRRGDYVTNNYAKKEHGLAPLKYYELAIKYLDKKIKQPRYFVFSDDLTWCKKNLALPENSVFVDGTKTRHVCGEIWLMQHCQHNIVANSSFSWWGAWLNENPDKIVIAPKVWFQNKETNQETEIVPSSWIRL